MLTSPHLGRTILRSFQEVSLHSPGLKWASLNRGLVQEQSECINVGFGEVHDLREVFKGEVVTVDFALNGINGIFSTGIVNGDIELGQMQGDGSGTRRGLDSVKVSFGSSFLVLSVPLPVIIPHPIRLTVRARKGLTRYVCPII